MANKLQLEIEHLYDATPSDVFAAIKKGVLFLQCGAKMESMKIDFREGGKYYLSFGEDGEVEGKFTKIIPNQAINFTWGNGTNVSIQLEAIDVGTKLKLTHADIPDANWLSAYKGGWEDGLSAMQSKV